MTTVSVNVDVDWREDVGKIGVEALDRLVRLVTSGSGDTSASREAARLVAKEFWLAPETIAEVPADKAYREWLANRGAESNEPPAGGASLKS